MHLTFTKFKPTSGFSYNGLLVGSIIISDDYIKANIIPAITYSGYYHIQSKKRNQFLKYTRYFTIKSDNEELIGAPFEEDFIIEINDNGKKVRIYKEDKTGIFLK